MALMIWICCGTDMRDVPVYSHCIAVRIGMPGVLIRLRGCQGCGVPGDAATRIWDAPVQQRGDSGAAQATRRRTRRSSAVHGMGGAGAADEQRAEGAGCAPGALAGLGAASGGRGQATQMEE